MYKRQGLITFEPEETVEDVKRTVSKKRIRYYPLKMCIRDRDTRLFDRMGKRIALTDTGERFLSHACDVMNQVNQARMSVTSTAELHGSLHIGTIESLACLKLPTVLQDVYKRQATFMSAVSCTYFILAPECLGSLLNSKTADGTVIVSYTHLDVYKRQVLYAQFLQQLPSRWALPQQQ